jgi:predicted enzyme related to lactoylglutathione lyase
MAITMPHGSGLNASPARTVVAMSARPSVPTTRSVTSLEAAVREIRLRGGRITSEKRTAPGIGSWAFVADADGVELVLWEDASATGS